MRTLFVLKTIHIWSLTVLSSLSLSDNFVQKLKTHALVSSNSSSLRYHVIMVLIIRVLISVLDSRGMHLCSIYSMKDKPSLVWHPVPIKEMLHLWKCPEVFAGANMPNHGRGAIKSIEWRLSGFNSLSSNNFFVCGCPMHQFGFILFLYRLL